MNDFEPAARERVRYDSASDTYRLSHDWTSSEPLSTTITVALEAVTETPAHRLTPLYEFVDPDGLNEVFQTDQDGVPHTDGRVCFPYETYAITVRASGDITIAERSGDGWSEGVQ